MAGLPIYSIAFDPADGPCPPAGKHVVDLSIDDLAHASLTVGRASMADVSRFPETFHAERLWRMNTVRAFITQADATHPALLPHSRFVATRAFTGLDPSEKVSVSYFLGLAATKALAETQLNIPWLMHLDVYADSTTYRVGSSLLENLERAYIATFPRGSRTKPLERLESLGKRKSQADIIDAVFRRSMPRAETDRHMDFLVRLAKGAKPDLFGVEVDSSGRPQRWTIFESKGSSSRPKHPHPDTTDNPFPSASHKLDQPLGDALLQALSRDWVESLTPSLPPPAVVPRHHVQRNVAVFTHFDAEWTNVARNFGSRLRIRPARGARADYPLGDTPVLQVFWKDPAFEGGNTDRNSIFDLEPLWQDYYGSILNLTGLLTGELREPQPVGGFRVDEADCWIEFHPALLESISRRDFRSIGRVLEKSKRHVREEDGASRRVLSDGFHLDGIKVRVGQTWAGDRRGGEKFV